MNTVELFFGSAPWPAEESRPPVVSMSVCVFCVWMCLRDSVNVSQFQFLVSRAK